MDNTYGNEADFNAEWCILHDMALSGVIYMAACLFQWPWLDIHLPLACGYGYYSLNPPDLLITALWNCYQYPIRNGECNNNAVELLMIPYMIWVNVDIITIQFLTSCSWQIYAVRCCNPTTDIIILETHMHEIVMPW